MSARYRGRSLDGLLSDFGHELPELPAPAPKSPREASLFRPAKRRGVFRRDAGWAPAGAPVSAWQMTTDQAPALWPWITSPALPRTGVPMGYDHLSQGEFDLDPLGWVLDEAMPVNNTNIVSLGDAGVGKSTTTKLFAHRAAALGYQIFVPGDIKDEYEALARWFGVEPFVIGPGMAARVNPLDLGPLGAGWDRLDRAAVAERATMIFRRWLSLLGALIGSQTIGAERVPFGPSEKAVLNRALASLTGYDTGATRLRETTIPQLWHAIAHPSDELVAELRYASRQDYFDATRLLRDALDELVQGTLAGMFDAPTTAMPDWDAPIATFSLSRLRPLGDEAVGIALACMQSWGSAIRDVNQRRRPVLRIRDEAYKELRLGPDSVKNFDTELRLGRNDKEINWINLHKASDPESAGDTGSQAHHIAASVLDLADIKILHGQHAKPGREIAELFGLTRIEEDIITGWAMQGRGRALWCIGADRRAQVQTQRHPLEEAFTDTNARLTERAPARAGAA